MENIQARRDNGMSQSAIARSSDGNCSSIGVCTSSVAMFLGGYENR